MKVLPQKESLVENLISNPLNNFGLNFNAGILKEIIDCLIKINARNWGDIADAHALSNSAFLNHNEIKL